MNKLTRTTVILTALLYSFVSYGHEAAAANTTKTKKVPVQVPYRFKALVERIIVNGGSRETNFTNVMFNDPKGEAGNQFTESGVVEANALSLRCEGVEIPLSSPCTILPNMKLKTQSCGDLQIVSVSNRYEIQASETTIRCIKDILSTKNKEGNAVLSPRKPGTEKEIEEE